MATRPAMAKSQCSAAHKVHFGSVAPSNRAESTLSRPFPAFVCCLQCCGVWQSVFFFLVFLLHFHLFFTLISCCALMPRICKNKKTENSKKRPCCVCENVRISDTETAPAACRLLPAAALCAAYSQPDSQSSQKIGQITLSPSLGSF